MELETLDYYVYYDQDMEIGEALAMTPTVAPTTAAQLAKIRQQLEANRNEDYMSRTIEEDLILTWFRTATREEWDNKDKHISDNNLCLMSAADIAIFLSTKARIVLQNSTTTMVSKILRKLKYVRIRKHGEGYLYIVRLLKEDDVTRNRRTLEEDDKTNLNDDHNNDLSGPQEPDPELPF